MNKTDSVGFFWGEVGSVVLTLNGTNGKIAHFGIKYHL